MRKTRLVILPTKCLHQMGFLLLFLSCPVIGDWGRIRPESENSHNAIQIDREGTCGFERDPPGGLLEFLNETGSKQCRLSENLDLKLNSKKETLIESLPTRRFVERQAERGNARSFDRITTEVRDNRNTMQRGANEDRHIRDTLQRRTIAERNLRDIRITMQRQERDDRNTIQKRMNVEREGRNNIQRRVNDEQNVVRERITDERRNALRQTNERRNVLRQTNERLRRESRGAERRDFQRESERNIRSNLRREVNTNRQDISRGEERSSQNDFRREVEAERRYIRRETERNARRDVRRETERNARDVRRESERNVRDIRRETERNARDIRRETERNARDVRRETERNARDVRRETERNVRDVRREIERNIVDVRRETERSTQGFRRETEQNIRDVRRETERITQDTRREAERKVRNLRADTQRRDARQEALRSAQRSTRSRSLESQRRLNNDERVRSLSLSRLESKSQERSEGRQNYARSFRSETERLSLNRRLHERENEIREALQKQLTNERRQNTRTVRSVLEQKVNRESRNEDNRRVQKSMRILENDFSRRQDRALNTREQNEGRLSLARRVEGSENGNHFNADKRLTETQKTLSLNSLENSRERRTQFVHMIKAADNRREAESIRFVLQKDTRIRQVNTDRLGNPKSWRMTSTMHRETRDVPEILLNNEKAENKIPTEGTAKWMDIKSFENFKARDWTTNCVIGAAVYFLTTRQVKAA